MSTRWQIVAKLARGHFGCIYIHCDGHPELVLPMLSAVYVDQARIDALIAAGDRVALGHDPGAGDLFYGRKGEEWSDVAPTYAPTAEWAGRLHLHGDEQHCYTWDGKTWHHTEI